MLKGILAVAFIVYALIATEFAYPTIVEMMDEGEDNIRTELSGPAVDGQWEFTKDVALLIQYAEELGYKVTLGEAWRHVHQQAYYVRHGYSTTMNSKHRQRRAIDLNLFINDKYMTDVDAYGILGKYWESLDEKNTWGGSWKTFKDAPHFERSY